ncbi:MAG: hypothetical protein GY851_04840 [bacterium]|nr:hypothetical protein [bacterium]
MVNSISSGNGIGPLIRGAQKQAMASMAKTQQQMDQAQNQGAQIIRAMLSASVSTSGIGTRLDLRA